MATEFKDYWFVTLLDNPNKKWYKFWEPKKTMQWTNDIKLLKIG